MAKSGSAIDAKLLSIVASERENSIGFEFDSELNAQREKALEYFAGEMKDMKAPGRNRSSVVDTAVAEAVETALPDLIEIFTTDEVVAFVPRGEEDVEAAEQEGEYLHHVFFNENAGFQLLYTGIKDALQVKVGVWKFWWDDTVEYSDERHTGKSRMELEIYSSLPDIEIEDVEENEPEYDDGETVEGIPGNTPEPTYDFTVRSISKKGCVRIASVPPEDFTVGADTIRLADATYCAMRSRVRAEQLIEDGYDPSVVAKLPAAATLRSESVSQARDTVDETDRGGNSEDMMRTVEIVEHYVRCNVDGERKIWRVVTGGDDATLLAREERNQIEFASICPFPVTHRFYGYSLADKLIEVQKIKTALIRMALDSGYFAMNQRLEVSEQHAGDYTISDLMNNIPGGIVRTRQPGGVNPIQAGSLGFDPMMALEYVSTMAEQRTGIVRNAQGLNPDTLHKTKGGMQALMTMAQKRLRLIARVMAETGIKDLFLGVHALIRQNATMAQKVRLRNGWVPIDPTTWGSRSDMTVEVGSGAGGREQDVFMLRTLLELQEKIVDQQGGAQGPLVDMQNVYSLLDKLVRRMGFKAPEMFFTDPSQNPQPEGGEEQPDPDAMKAQAEMQIKQSELELKREEMQARLQLDREKAEAEMQLAIRRQEMDMQIQRERMAIKAQMGRLPQPRGVSAMQPGGALDR